MADPAGFTAAPPASMTDHQMRGHLRFLHGCYTEPSLPLAELARCHRVRHVDPDPPYDLPHTHRAAS